MSSLEQAFDAAAGKVPTWCPTCRGPRTDLPMIVWLHRGERIGQCPSCGGATAPDGTSVRRWTSEGLSEVPYTSVVEDYEERYPDAAPFDPSQWGYPDAEPAG